MTARPFIHRPAVNAAFAATDAAAESIGETIDQLGLSAEVTVSVKFHDPAATTVTSTTLVYPSVPDTVPQGWT